MGGAARHPRRPRRALPHPARDGADLSVPADLPADAVTSPNIWFHPATYEIENRACDPHGRLAEAITRLAPFDDRVLLDLGCGTGFHLPWFAASAARVVGVEPHPSLVATARRRVRAVDHVAVLRGSAASIPLPDASVDIVHVRWAYFFGPGCEPGLAEIDRVLRRGGRAVVIDNDATRSTFGGWFRRGYPMIDPGAVERFWSTHGWQREPIDMGWSFETRADFEAVVGIEFDPALAAEICAEHPGTDVDYAVNVFWRAG